MLSSFHTPPERVTTLLRWTGKLAVLWALGYVAVLGVTRVPLAIFYSAGDSRSGLEFLGAYLKTAREVRGKPYESFLQFYQEVAKMDPSCVSNRSVDADNPFPGALPEKRFGRMLSLPGSLDPGETPLLWDTQPNVEGHYFFLLWDGTLGCLPVDVLPYELPNMEVLRKCGRSLDPLMSHLANKAGVRTLETLHCGMDPPPLMGWKQVLIAMEIALLLGMSALVFLWFVRPIFLRSAR
jgi:hypothetical protein